jgi:hypothetical protein
VDVVDIDYQEVVRVLTPQQRDVASSCHLPMAAQAKARTTYSHPSPLPMLRGEGTALGQVI